ncbi:MAG: SGNH/GDSL hydrolase family protein [Gemmataceae bacterium]
MNRAVVILLALLPAPLCAADFQFRDGDRVVLIGSTLIEREQRYGYWEAALTAANPDKTITFRNLGWSGDTVWGEARADFGTAADGYKHLIEHVKAEKPTVLIVGYGTNESFAGPAGLPKFQEQLKKLLDDLAPTKARLVMLAPMKMFKMPPPLPDPTKANGNIQLYSDAIKEEAKRRVALFVDFNEMFSIPVPQPDENIGLATDNGMHLTANGYAMTGGYLAGIGGGHAALANIRMDVNAHTCEATFAAKVSRDGDVMRFRITAASVPIPYSVVEGEKVGGPLFFVKGAAVGEHLLKVDGKPVTIIRSEKYPKIGLIGSGPDLDQGEKLRQTIIAKNELYFHRWRPANITYLFLFRKYEQGQNAREIPQFDPLVAAKEQEIAKLRKPVEHVYELVPAKK